MTSEIDRQSPDFLIADKYADTSQEFRDLSLSNQILLGIWREIRKAHPSQRCVVDLQFSNPLKVLNNGDDTVECRFLAMGKKVQSQYLIVNNNTDTDINVGLNEPVMRNNVFGSGIRVNGVAAGASHVLHVPVELEYISIRLMTAGAGPLSIPINNSTPVANPGGQIQVYAWTIPFSDRDDTE